MNEYSRTFVYKDDKSNKFWTIDVKGTGFTVTFGKVGANGQQSAKDFADEAACKKAADKLIAEKTGKGYVEDTSKASGAPSATGAVPASAKTAAAKPAAPAAASAVPAKSAAPVQSAAKPASAPPSAAKSGSAASTEPAPLDVLTCYVALYLESKDMKRLFGAEKIRAALDEKDLAILVKRLYEEWISAGADAKTKGMMTLYAIHGGDEAVRELKAKVKEFDYALRSAMAGDAVRAIAVSDSPAALVTVDTLGRTYQNKLVRRMAAEALEEAAKLRGITVEELADKIVPNLGLDEKGELHLATNARSWTARLGGDLKITLYNSDDKKISAFPAISKDEDEFQYAAAKEELSLLKKELRSVVSGQTQRLELILSSGRGWDKAAYEELFIKNPVMSIFATSLIFGKYVNGKLTDTFRYNGDGTCSGPDDSAYELPADGEIRLVHPLHLSDELKAQWKQQLADYEIAQPFPQLDRKIYAPEKADESKTEYSRFKGTYVNGGGFVRRMFKSNWRRGDILDGGSYADIAKNSGGLLLEVHFGEIDDFCVGNESEGTSIELESLTFTQTESNKELCLKDVPPELYSETVYTVEAAIAAAGVKEEE